MGKSPWVRFFPSDWLAGTRGMSAAETGVYITLVAMLYESQAPIRNDETRLSRLCGLPVASYRKIVSALVEQDKITLSDGMLWNRRVGVELQIRIEKTEAASKSAKAKWSKNSNKSTNESCERNANAMRTQCYPEARVREEDNSSLRSLSHSSENDLFEQTDNGTGNQLAPIAKPAAEPQGDHARFVEFWQTYPKRLGTNSRKEASAKFTRAVKSGTDPAEIIAGAARYAAHCDETGKTSTDKVQQATTWLNQANWETDYGRQQLNNRQQPSGRAIQGNPVLANAITRLEERRLRFTDPETGSYDNRAADAFGEAERDRIRAQFYPNTFGRG